jgi:hypothetical protein
MGPADRWIEWRRVLLVPQGMGYWQEQEEGSRSSSKQMSYLNVDKRRAMLYPGLGVTHNLRCPQWEENAAVRHAGMGFG